MKRLLLLSIFFIPLQAWWKWSPIIVRTYIDDMSAVPQQDMTSYGVPNFTNIPFVSGVVGAVPDTPYALRSRQPFYTYYNVTDIRDAMNLRNTFSRYPIQWYYYNYGQDNPPRYETIVRPEYHEGSLPEEVEATQMVP